MGTWAEFTKYERPKPPHVHEKPWDEFEVPTNDLVPAVGSVWRCSCGRTWKVSKVTGRTSTVSALLKWSLYGEPYALMPFNYDQPLPRGMQ